ncbi:MAG: helix-turn-helix domain-containing protein [Symbiobacteriaceae bacterium]
MKAVTKRHLWPRYLNSHAIREQRVRAGLTQQALGDRAGLTQSAISKIETGRVGCSVPVLHRLAQALGCPVDALMALDVRDAA